MGSIAFSRSLFFSNKGSAVIEFAIIAPVFFLIFFAVTEFGLFMYHKIIIERIAVDVSRAASIGKTVDSSCPFSTTGNNQLLYLNCVIKNGASALIDRNNVRAQINVLSSGGTVTPDLCLDSPNNPTPAICTTFEDVNGNGTYDSLGGSNTGARGEIIEVRIIYPWRVRFPIMNNFFGSATHKGIVLVSASTIIKNEPL